MRHWVFLVLAWVLCLCACEPIQEKVQPSKEVKIGPWYQSGKRLQEVIYQDIRNLNNYVERPIYDSTGQCVGMQYTTSGRSTGTSRLDFQQQPAFGFTRTTITQANMPAWLWPSNTVSYSRAELPQAGTDTLWAEVLLQEKFNLSSRGRVAWLAGLHISTQGTTDVRPGITKVQNTWSSAQALQAVVSSAAYQDTIQYALITQSGFPVITDCRPLRHPWSCTATVGGGASLPWTMVYRHVALSTAGFYAPAFTSKLGALEQLPKLSSISYQIGGSSYGWGPVSTVSTNGDTLRYNIPFQAGTDRSTWQVTEIWK